MVSAGYPTTQPVAEREASGGGFSPSKFRLEIPGVRSDAVRAVSPVVVRFDAAGAPQFPNVSFTLAQTDAQPWLDSMNRGEKGGTLIYLANDGKTEVLRVSFKKMRVAGVSRSLVGVRAEVSPVIERIGR
jgi:hypothetical protein